MRAVGPTAVLLALLGGCERDPSFYGVWDLVRVERAGEVQTDAGVLEILDGGELALFLRYTWSGGGFAPDPRPSVVRGDTLQTSSGEAGDGYRDKDETYTLLLTPFGETPFDVAAYDLDRARLTSPAAAWPDRPDDLRPTELVLQR